MGETAEDRVDTAGARASEAHSPQGAGRTDGEQGSDDDAVAAERTGRTNTARDMTAGPERGVAPGRWDSIGEPGEGLDELQGLYANDTASQDQLPEHGDEPTPAGNPSASAATISPSVWDQLVALEGKTVGTPKGEPFRVIAVRRGAGVTVSPLDGSQEWVVPARELAAGWEAVNAGAPLDGLASIRLQEAGVGSAHPEYVAGLLRAITNSAS